MSTRQGHTPGSNAADEIRDLYAYNRWANNRILEASAQLDDEEFIRNMNSSFPSVGQTLAHLVEVDWVWLSRWTGSSPAEVPNSWDLSSLPKIRRQWEAIEDDRSAFLAGLSAEDVLGQVSYKATPELEYRAPLWQLLRHVVNHSTYHRGQLTTMIRQLGREPISTDLVLFHRQGAPNGDHI